MLRRFFYHDSAAHSDLVLRSIAKRCVSKDGNDLNCSPPFETPACGGLLRVRSTEPALS